MTGLKQEKITGAVPAVFSCNLAQNLEQSMILICNKWPVMLYSLWKC